MKAVFVVVDHEGNVSFNAEKGEPESFRTMPAAKRRADKLARSSPGEQINIYKLCCSVMAPVGKPETIPVAS